MPKYSIVIPTFNHLEDCLKPCLQSIIEHTDLSGVEVIVVANGCTDKTREYVESLGYPFRLIWMDNQSGFIIPTNAGIRASLGEYIVLLNNDVVLLPQKKGEWLEMLAKPLLEDSKIGISGPYKDVQFFWENDRIVFHEDYLVFYCAMIRKQVFDSIGLLDVAFGMGYQEDMDFCIRAKKAGFRISQVPNDVFYDLNITKSYLEKNPNSTAAFPAFHKDKMTFRDIAPKTSQHERNRVLNKHSDNPKYSIIIPTYNHLEDCLKPCIESIQKFTDLNTAEVIVVANGCTDGTRDYVHSLGYPFKLHWIDEPAGYTRATNAGIKVSRGEYVVLLNNDNVILPSPKNYWLETLESPFKTDPLVGITGAAKDIHEGTNSEFLLFFCAMIKWDIIKKMGPLDEIFNPGYGEDIDYCNKVKRSGYKIVQVPNDVSLEGKRRVEDHAIQFPIWHKGSQTVSTFPGWDVVVPRNEQILAERYLKKVGLKEFNAGRMFDTDMTSEQINPALDSIMNRLAEGGKLVAELDDRTDVTLVKSGFANGLFKGKTWRKASSPKPSWPSGGLGYDVIKKHVCDIGSKDVNIFGGTWKGGFCIQQNPHEAAMFLSAMQGKKFSNFLEIGCADYGMTRLMCDVLDIENVFTIDLGWQDQNWPDVCRENIECLSNTGSIHIFRGDSHGAEAEDWLKGFGPVFDLIFIDGDHSYNSVVLDFAMAKKYAKPGCYFVFHDYGCIDDVARFTSEISASTDLSVVGKYLDIGDTKKGLFVLQYTPDKKQPAKTIEYSIIIPTLNHLDDCLKPCIESIIRNTDLSNVEVIVVANGCTDKTREYVESLGSTFKLVWMNEAAGYPKAVNAGISQSQGEYVVLLNNDTMILDYLPKNTWLDMLVKPFQTDSLVGVSGPFLERFKPQSCDYKFLIFFCAMIQRKLFNEIGLLDEAFSMGGGEDTDFCIKAQNKGYKIAQVPENTPGFYVSKDAAHSTFPLWHQNGVTRKENPNMQQIVQYNDNLLFERYIKMRYSIVIPTYNHFEDCLKPCLQSIIESTDLSNVEVIVVANGCTDGTKEYVESLGRSFKLIWIDEPVGYIKATNAGIRAACGEYVVLLNNDTAIVPTPKNEWLEMLRRPFKSGRKVGITGPLKSWRDDVRHEYILFFCAMMPRPLFDEIGLLDENFGIGYHEDVDFCMRVKRAGYELAEVPHNVEYRDGQRFPPELKNDFPIYHKGGGTFAPIFGDNPERLTKHVQKLLDKHRPYEKGKVYDCFMFYNEVEVLNIRLNELKDVVDKFVIVEARYSHQGKPKPLYFEKNRSRFNEFMPKIIHIVVDEFPQTNDPWVREHFQRDAISRGLKNCSDNDVIIISDADEIPKASVVKNYLPAMGICCIETTLYYYKLNYQSNDKWYKVRIFPYSAMKGKTPQDFRGKDDYSYDKIIPNGGWHFSFIGDKEHIRNKIDNYAHAEFNTDQIKSDQNILDAINNGRDVFGRNLRFNAVNIDNTFPKYILDNIDMFGSQGLIAGKSEGSSIEDVSRRIRAQDSWVYEEVIQWNSYNVERAEVLGRNILDVGANIGAFAVHALSFGASNVVCFEPHPANRRQLIENLKPFSNVCIREEAIFSPGVTDLVIQFENQWAQVATSGDGIKIKVIDLKEALREFPVNDNELVLKIDVEAAEYDILLNADPSDILRFKTIYAEFHNKLHKNSSYNMDMLEQKMIEIGYDSIPVVEYALYGTWFFNPEKNQMEFAPVPAKDRTTKLYKFSRKVSSKPQVYDCFSFFNELDLLEIRLNELDPYVDYFVLAEATVTHSGNPKPLYFLDNKERFQKFAHKIIHIIVDDCPQTDDPWIREHFQRNALNRGLTKCKDSDIIMVSDLDEIPRGSSIAKFDGSQQWMYFEQHEYDYYLNNSIGISKAEPGVYSRITTYGTLKKLDTRCTDLRYRDCSPANRIPDGGWHFSWIGGAEQIVKKLEAWAHQELNIDSYKNVPSINQNIDSSMDAFGRHKIRGIGLVNVDSTFPKFIVDNYDSFVQKKMISPIKRSATDSKVAIVMPYFNDPSWMIRSVMAVLGQTFQNWTLFLIDDGSTDPNKAATILGQKLNNRICILEKPNGGPSSARNLALAHIRSDPSFTHVAYCDADDIWADDYLESQLSNMGDADFIYSKVTDKFDNWQTAYRFGIPDPDEYPGLQFMLRSPFIFISSVVHKVGCLSVGSFDSNLDSIEDWDMWVRIAKAGYKFKKNNNVTITYIVKTNSSMAGRRTDKITSIFRDKHADDLHLVSQ